MKDTTPEIEARVCEIIRTKTPEERYKMGCSMYETSRYLLTRAILEENPHISPLRLKQQLFLKFYGNDFNETEKKKILEHFEKLEQS